MKSPTKNRLLTILLVLAMALIAWHVLFSSTLSQLKPDLKVVPKAPVFKTFAVDIPHKNADQILAEPLPKIYQASTTKGGEPFQQILNQQNLPIYWTLKVAALSSKEKAVALQKNLAEVGYRTDIEVVSVTDQLLFSVYTTPKIDKAAVQKMKQAIDKRFTVDSIIMQHQ